MLKVMFTEYLQIKIYEIWNDTLRKFFSDQKGASYSID